MTGSSKKHSPPRREVWAFSMTQLAHEKRLHPIHLRTPSPEISEPAWLQKIRRTGGSRFEQLGYPSNKDESWRFTNISALAKTQFAVAEPREYSGEVPFTLGQDAIAELVFIDGHFVLSLSGAATLPAGVVVGSIADALASHAKSIESHFGRYAEIQHAPFVALNSASFKDGAFISVPRGTALDRPIHLLFLSSGEGSATASHPRTLLLVGDDASAKVVETYAGIGTGAYLTNAVTEIVLGERAKVDHNKFQQESLAAYHIASMQVRVASRGDFISHSTTLGGRLTRNDLNVVMAGEYAHATLNGLVIVGGQQHCDNHTQLDHASPNCPSHELYKHVLSDKATGVFKGKILVRQPAQKTDSKQTSKSLLLSDDAVMNSQPALEIYADDVKCTHGSTTGPVDEDMVFYLRSRGVSLEAARHLLTYAFAADITRRIAVEPIRRRIEDFLAAQHGLPQDLRITDLGSHDEKAR